MSRHRNPGGFTISSFSVLTLVLFLAVAAAQMWQVSNRQGFGLPLVTIFLATPIIFAIVVAGLAYLIFRKSDTAGNAGFTVVLLIATVGRLVVMTGLIPQGTSTRSLIRGNSPSATPPSQGTSTPNRARPAPPTPRPAQASGPTNPAPFIARPVAPAPQAPASQAPASRAPAERTPPPQRADDPRIATELKALTEDLDAAAGALSLQAEQVMDALAKPPRADRAGLAQRQKDLEALKKASTDLEERFGGVQDEAQKRLAALIPASEAFPASVRFAAQFNGGWRASACRDYASMCDAAAEETQFLLDNLGKWSVDAKGQLTSKDLMISGRARGFRMHVDSYLGRRANIAERLRGK